MRDTTLRSRYQAAFLLVLSAAFAAAGCSAFMHGYGLQSVQGRMMRIRNGPGADRLDLESAFDSNIHDMVFQYGTPDYILVESGTVVRLFYISNDRVLVCTRSGFNPNSMTSVETPIAAGASMLMTDADRVQLASVRRAAEESAIHAEATERQVKADADLRRAETELAAAKARAEAQRIERRGLEMPTRTGARAPQVKQLAVVREDASSKLPVGTSARVQPEATTTPRASATSTSLATPPLEATETPIETCTPTVRVEATPVPERQSETDASGIPASTLPQQPTNSKALSMMELAFIGNPSRVVIKPLLDRAMMLYRVAITEDSYNRVGSILVAVRKQTGVPELEILTYMARSIPADNSLTFSDAASLAASSIRLSGH